MEKLEGANEKLLNENTHLQIQYTEGVKSQQENLQKQHSELQTKLNETLLETKEITRGKWPFERR